MKFIRSLLEFVILSLQTKTQAQTRTILLSRGKVKLFEEPEPILVIVLSLQTRTVNEVVFFLLSFTPPHTYSY